MRWILPNGFSPGITRVWRRGRIFAAVFICASFAVPAISAAEMTVLAGTESFHWAEFAPSGKELLSETGYRPFAGFAYLQDGGAGMLFGYHAKVYSGDVRYDGQTQSGTPVSTTTSYTGMVNEVDLHYRLRNGPADRYYWDLVGGIGLDFWRRDIKSAYSSVLGATAAGYVEEYLIGYLRAGVNFNRVEYGFQGEAGVKYPISTWEKANLQAGMGADSDPVLEPGKSISYYASLGYRFDSRWNVIFGYDSYRFSRSSSADMTIKGQKYSAAQPESREDLYSFSVGYSFGANPENGEPQSGVPARP